ncbi:Uncharacterised protein [Citrobacter freundii]|nr:Uncharacterised protein [Citrobacter freundii]
MMVSRQHQNSLFCLHKSRQLIQQQIQLAFIEQRDSFFIACYQTVKRFRKLMRVLLDKLVCDFANTAIKTVRRIQITTVALTEVLLECGGQRKLCSAEPVNCLPVIPYGEQRSL